MAKKRTFSTFSLAFLDIMSCGLGAVALVFLIIKHEVTVQQEQQSVDLMAEVNLLEEEVAIGKENLVKAKNIVSEYDQELAVTDGLAKRVNEDIDAVKLMINEIDPEALDQQVKDLAEKIDALEKEREKLLEETIQGDDVLNRVGQGDRQYLTGLKLGGERILILLDASASMLDSTIVNIVIKKNMSDEVKRTAPKWTRALKTVDWIVSQLPQGSSYQIYAFNTRVTPLLEGTKDKWLSVDNTEQVEKALLESKSIVPSGGTSLKRVFLSITQFETRPDNVFLITDGLPTQGLAPPTRTTVSGSDRLELFNQAVEVLPGGIPMNILLWPMEGDPMAAAAFWRLAMATSGAFLSPSKDWP